MEVDAKIGAMPRERDDETGMYQQSYPHDLFVKTIQEMDQRSTTSSLVTALGCSQRTALNRLHELEDDGRVTSEKVGNSYVWTVTSSGDN